MYYRYNLETGLKKIKTKSAMAFTAVTVGFGGLIMAVAIPLGAHAATPAQTSLTNNNWRVFSAMPATAKFWDITQAKSDGSGGVQFPFQQYDTKTTGSFAVYLENNYNVDLTGKTINVSADWTQALYSTRSTIFPGAYARVEFQDVASGNYSSSDYWWYSGTSLDLNGGTNGTISASLADRNHWSNLCGKLATDNTSYPGPNCVGSTDSAVSPYDGFTNAMKNVKQVSLSFGSAGSYASGVAPDNSNSSFNLKSFTVEP